MRKAALLPLALLAISCLPPQEGAESPALPAWETFVTGSRASLRGLSAADGSTAWASGTGGTVLATADGGATWTPLEVPGAGSLDFRDVELLTPGVALLMTAGQPARIYRTEDGGDSFDLVHESPYPQAFFDSMAFWDGDRGLAFSDPVDGRFLVLKTADGGGSWQEVDPAALPSPRDGEAGFAASGSNLAVAASGHAWIGTGGSVARVLYSRDFGETWAVAEPPMRSGSSSQGIFSIAFRDPLRGLAAGGDYQAPQETAGNLARTTDGGRTWTPPATPPPSGHRAAVAFLPGRPEPTWLAVGRGGCDLSFDDGSTWQTFSEPGFYTLAVAADGTAWAAGSDGRVARLLW